MDLVTRLSDPATAGAVIAVLLALILVLLWLRRRAGGTVEARLRRASGDLLANFLVPDGEGGEIHVEYALLSRDAIVVLDIKDVEGHVFGSNAMPDWTVLADRRRFTFSNPQPALYDRVAAVRRLVPDVPVEGYVAFTASAKFTKGRPGDVVMLEEFIGELQTAQKGRGPVPDSLRPGWDRLRHEAVAAQVGQLMRR